MAPRTWPACCAHGGTRIPAGSRRTTYRARSIEHGPTGPPDATAPRAYVTLPLRGARSAPDRWVPASRGYGHFLRHRQNDEVCSSAGPGRERGLDDGIGALVRREILLGHHVPAHDIAHVP